MRLAEGALPGSLPQASTHAPADSSMRDSGGVTCRIRPARLEDLDDVSRISVAAYEAAGQVTAASPYRTVLADALSRHQGAQLLVAERAGQVVGTVTICPPDSAFSEVGLEDELEFRFLAVDPDEWGTGVADALIQACEDEARTRQARALTICVRDTNTGAAAMYARRGFTRVPDRDWTSLPEVHLLALTRPVTQD